MIKVDEKCVAITGREKEIVENLIKLHIAIMKDPELMQMDLLAMDAAVDLVKNDNVSGTIIKGKEGIEELMRKINGEA